MRHKILWSLEIQTDHQILARKPDLVIINKKKKKKKKEKEKEKNKNLVYCGLCRPCRAKSKNQRKRKERQVIKPCQRTEKLWNMKVTVIPIIIGALGTTHKGLIRRLEDLEIRGWAETILTIDSIVEIGQNTEKSPGHLKRFAVTETVTERPSANAGVKNLK